MKEITDNEMHFILSIFKSPEVDFNANSIAKHLGISSMGALKIAKRLKKENVLISKDLGKARFYKLNFENNYVTQYLRFLLKRESEQTHSYIKVWINEIKKIKNADAAILFGSVLRKQKDAKDIEAVLITDKRHFSKLKREIEEINLINIKKLHPVYQTKNDFIKNIKSQDKVLLNAIKGVVAFGEEIIIKLLEK